MFKLRRGPLPLDKEGVISGIARVDTRTKRLIGKLQPGEVAVIDHDDLDRIAAESLVERKVKAVLNAAPSSTGRYPNLGPLVLMAAGIPLIDSLGPALLAGVKDGDRVNIEGSKVSVGSGLISEGEVITLAIAEERLDECKKDIGAALESFAENTLQYMVTERDFLLEAIRLPEIRTSLAGRHVLVVVRGYGYKEDLASLRSSYLRDFRPVLIAVDGGADALLELKLKPDIIIGDMDSVTTQALTCGAELIVHAYADGRAPGEERLSALGLEYSTFEAPGTSEDVALLLAHEKGAELIVAVGARASMVEFMDKGRKGMASTFLVRLRVGPKLVDAKGVSELHRGGPTRWELFGVVLAALVAMLIVVGLSQPMHLVVKDFFLLVKNIWFSVENAFH
ncbi:MAG: putative cytokinetic ring protein SteA [Actinomycetota bacterium]